MIPLTLVIAVSAAQSYLRPDQSCPFDDRFAGLRDPRAAARIDTVIRRLERGLRPDVRAVGRGVQEARIDHGPGYRVYFGLDGVDVIVLLLCGDKRTQSDDIALAHAMWAEYRARKAGPASLLKPRGT